MSTDHLQNTTIEQLGKIVSDPSLPIAKRMRAIFSLRNLGTNEAVDALKKSLRDPSVLLAHEVAYCMGQMRNPYAIPFLVDVLRDSSLNPMVRHEAGEALGAIGSNECIPILQEFSHDPTPEVAETCQVALELIFWKQQNPDKSNANGDNSLYFSVDPAPPEELTDSSHNIPHISHNVLMQHHENDQLKKVEQLRQQLLNTNLSIFKRYRALFALRNLGTPDAVKAICEGLHDSSALFRHEVAYVLGQLQNPIAVPSLIQILSNTNEHAMVRHEAAEALGSIGSFCDKSNESNNVDVLEMLEQYRTEDPHCVVRESAAVALDIAKYWMEDEFHYTDGVQVSE